MLFLHGYGSKKESFYYQTEFLGRYYTVIAPDLPGFGANRGLERAWSVDDYAQWVSEFAAAQKLDRPHIIAHSFGARVALKLLSSRTDFASKLVITGGAGLVKERSERYVRKVKAYRRMKKIFPRFAEKRYGSAEYRALSPVMKESYKKIVNEDLRECASRIVNPTLLIYGADDNVTPPHEEGATFHGLIGGSRLEIIGGGHFCFCEHPEVFNRMVYGFLSE